MNAAENDSPEPLPRALRPTGEHHEAAVAGAATASVGCPPAMSLLSPVPPEAVVVEASDVSVASTSCGQYGRLERPGTPSRDQASHHRQQRRGQPGQRRPQLLPAHSPDFIQSGHSRGGTPGTSRIIQNEQSSLDDTAAALTVMMATAMGLPLCLGEEPLRTATVSATARQTHASPVNVREQIASELAEEFAQQLAKERSCWQLELQEAAAATSHYEAAHEEERRLHLQREQLYLEELMELRAMEHHCQSEAESQNSLLEDKVSVALLRSEELSSLLHSASMNLGLRDEELEGARHTTSEVALSHAAQVHQRDATLLEVREELAAASTEQDAMAHEHRQLVDALQLEYRQATDESDLQQLSLRKVSRRLEAEMEELATCSASLHDARNHNATLVEERSALAVALTEEAAKLVASEENAQWQALRRAEAERSLTGSIAQQQVLMDEVMGARHGASEATEETMFEQKQRSRDLQTYTEQLHAARQHSEVLWKQLQTMKLRHPQGLSCHTTDVGSLSEDFSAIGTRLDHLVAAPMPEIGRGRLMEVPSTQDVAVEAHGALAWISSPRRTSFGCIDEVGQALGHDWDKPLPHSTGMAQAAASQHPRSYLSSTVPSVPPDHTARVIASVGDSRRTEAVKEGRQGEFTPSPSADRDFFADIGVQDLWDPGPILSTTQL